MTLRGNQLGSQLLDIYNDRKSSIVAEIKKENQELDRIATA
jgi:hypothetical protein